MGKKNSTEKILRQRRKERERLAKDPWAKAAKSAECMGGGGYNSPINSMSRRGMKKK